ncbi:MAG TPA: TonB-dependent receptor [Blastocatellia bacterium]|nr:TonB-dependent receptor [Blastocatellia bacterium]
MKRVSPFRTGAISLFASFAILLCSSGLGLAQDIATKGGISGRVTDSAGAAIVNAKITITGGAGDRTVTANSEGEFDLQNLIPGSYKVKVELSGFKTLNVPGVEVFVGKTSALKLTLETGNISEVVEVTAGAAAVDTTSTAIGSNLNQQLYENLPLQRTVTSLFYLTPGVTDSLGGGSANPSISGGSALDNLYVADGVNITDASFGGLGVFSRVYGTLGVGINTSYIQEVQVKTGGFEPQYGQAQGGIVNIITKSGTSEYHGAFYGFSRPNAFEAGRQQRDDVRTNKIGKILAEEQYDVGADIGGPIPKLDKLFFFGSFNPSFRREIVRGAEGSGLRQLFGDQTHRRFYSKNYALKLDFNANPNHQFNFSLFGDPTITNKAPHNTLNIDNTTSNSVLDYGTRNLATRYNGSINPSWTVSASFSQGRNVFNERDFDNLHGITDFTGQPRGTFRPQGIGFFEPTDSTTYRATGDTQKQVSFWGKHTFGVGYQYQRAFYNGIRDRSGARLTVPSTNATGINAAAATPNTPFAIPAAAAGQTLNGTFQLRVAPEPNADNPDILPCTLCPFMSIPGLTSDIGFGAGVRRVFLLQDRGEYGGARFETESKYHAAYAQDTWQLNKYITALLGYRWEQERLIGSRGATGDRLSYLFNGNWSPRFGVTVDPTGAGKMKAYYNFGRFHEYIPLDLAERSLSTEKGFNNARFAPDFTTVNGQRRVTLNQQGTVNVVVDNAHLLSRAAGGFPGSGVGISVQDNANPILPGTKLGYADEHLVGFEMQLPRNMVLSVRYIDRKLKRIVEDAAVVSPEGFDFFGQTYFIGNINSKVDAAVNPVAFKFSPQFNAAGDLLNLPSQCDPDLVNTAVTNSAGNAVGGICFAALGKNGQPAGDPGGDGVADGFPDPVHKYRGVEIELNKRFSNSWQLLANWRIAKVQGNYEGHFRNDNGQRDPAISSLFDFTAGEYGLLGDQFAVGPINTDRRHISNIFANYVFGESGFGRALKGLNLGGGLHLESGVPISELLAHPAYNNAGEIPSGGRGKLGRTDFFPRFDMSAAYTFNLNERWKMRFSSALFNVFNNRDIRLPDQNRQISVGFDNPDFQKPLSYRLPFAMTLGLKLDF